MLTWEADILLWIQEVLRNDILNPLMIGYTYLGNAGLMWLVMIGILFINKSTRKVSILALVSLAITFLICNGILKPVVARTRPYEVIESLHLLVNKQWDYSFPSGHTAASFSVAWILYFQMNKKIGWTALFLAILMAFSRLYVGVHYPTDVLAAFVISSLVACGVQWIYVHKIAKIKKS